MPLGGKKLRVNKHVSRGVFYLVFVDVEPMTSNNIFWDTKGTELGRIGGERTVKALTQPHLQRRWSDRDHQVIDQLDSG